MKNKLLILALLCLSVLSYAQLTLPTSNQVFISVNVTGFVPNPGTYQLTPVNRLSDAISMASTGLETPLTTELMTPQQAVSAERDSLYKNFQALRSVKLVRGKETLSCDLQKFMRMGDLGQNPLLRDGDVIIVAPIAKSVSIWGEVYIPGEYEYLEGDDLQDLFDLAQGFTLGADRKSVSIYRYKDSGGTFDLLRYDLRSQIASSISLKEGDRIIVAQDSEARRAWKITVEGNVKAPGEYLISENTTLYDILLQCGGPTLRGDLNNALYAYRPVDSEIDVEFERLKELSLAQMSIMEYQYLLNRMRQYKGKYGISVAEVWAGKGSCPNPVLHNGDYLFVPEIMDMVEVRGQVVNPGLVPFVEGKNWEYYIQAAGGYTNNKRWNGTRIISASSGNWLKPSKKYPLMPGDTVFVAEKTERDLWTDVKDILLVATQLVTVFLGVRAITTN